jgi:hypothetical protein
VVNLGDDCASPPGEFAPRLCAGATSCQSATDGGSTCQPFKTAGMRCDPFGFGECAMDTTCAGGDDGGTQCVALKRIGEQCAGGGLGVPCQAGLSCTNQLCSALVAPGGTCFEDQDCVAGHGCGIGGVCQPYGGPDAGCNTANFQDDCAVGLFCNSTSARCERRRGLDALCTGNECSLERGLTCVGGVGGGVSHCRPAFCLGP